MKGAGGDEWMVYRRPNSLSRPRQLTHLHTHPPPIPSPTREERKKRYVEQGKADQRAAKKQRRGDD